MAYKKKHDDRLGFTSINDHGVEKGQCLIYFRELTLSNESVRPMKLSNHLEKIILSYRIIYN